jgi:hypothetical protein
MHKLLPLLPLIVTASISVGRPAAAEWRLAGPLSHHFATDMAGSDAAVVPVAGKGGGGTGGGAMTGGMGGGAATGGMGGGATTGGMGGGAATGGMGGGAATGGMGGGAATGGMGGGMFGGEMPNNPAPSLGTNSSSGSPVNSAQPSYYTYQCATPGGGCSIVAPASLRSSSFRPGARCSCSDGLSQGQIK